MSSIAMPPDPNEPVNLNVLVQTGFADDDDDETTNDTTTTSYKDKDDGLNLKPPPATVAVVDAKFDPDPESPTSGADATVGKTADIEAVLHEADQWVLVTGKTFVFKADLRERFDAVWDADHKGWTVDWINLQHDDDGVTTPQLLCEWLQAKIDVLRKIKDAKKLEADIEKKRQREAADIAKKRLKIELPLEKKRCYSNAKLYASNNLPRTFVQDGFYAQCPACQHHLYGMDTVDNGSSYYSLPIQQCWQCDTDLETAVTRPSKKIKLK